MAKIITEKDLYTNATTTIRIKRSTKEKLCELGHKGMSYDDLINELIDSFTEGE